MMELSAHLQQLLQKRLVCFFATLMPDGSPQLTQTWVDTDGTVTRTINWFSRSLDDDKCGILKSRTEFPIKLFLDPI
jgi:hypothetical protein